MTFNLYLTRTLTLSLTLSFWKVIKNDIFMTTLYHCKTHTYILLILPGSHISYCNHLRVTAFLLVANNVFNKYLSLANRWDGILPKSLYVCILLPGLAHFLSNAKGLPFTLHITQQYVQTDKSSLQYCFIKGSFLDFQLIKKRFLADLSDWCHHIDILF